MTLTNELRADLVSMSPSSVIELYAIETSYELHGDGMLYLFSSTVNATYGLTTVIWSGEEYWPFPIEAEGFAYNGKGTLPRPTIRVSNTQNVITSILAEVNAYNPGNDLIGAKVTRIRTLARFLDAVNFTGDINPYGTPDPESKLPDEIYYIDRKSMESRDLVEFELVARYDLTGIRAPKRQCLKRCGWVYRGDGCGYAGGAWVTVPLDSPAPQTPRVVPAASGVSGYVFSGQAAGYGLCSFDFDAGAGQCIGDTGLDENGVETLITGSGGSPGQTYVAGKYYDENDNEVFSAEEDKCGHRLSSCKLRFGANGQLPYGGFPGIGNYNF
ncbi:MAG: phage minor tail protein L [Synechococcus sp. ELA619]